MLGKHWYANWMIETTSESLCCWKPTNKFLLKRINGLENVGWRIPRWLLSTRQSLVCKWNDFSYFWVSILPEASHQVSDQEDIWFKRSWLKNSKMAVWCWTLFDTFIGNIPAFLCYLSACWLPSSFCSRKYMNWKIMMFEEFLDGCLVLGSFW